ncbi:atypical chemokine receptor 1 [Eudromia elegans]
MGNCVPASPSVEGNQEALDLSELMENFSYSYNYSGELDYSAVEPCHDSYCALFQRAAPAFLGATGLVAALGTGALLAALARRGRAWPGRPGRTLAAQLAAAAVLFALPLPFLATGVARGWHLGTVPCQAAHALWHWSLFAQGLLLAGGSCGAAREPPRWWCLPALWAAALLLAVPAALSSGTVAAPPACVARAHGALAPAALAALALGIGLFLLLPRAAGLFFALWAPHGAGLAADALLRAGLLRPASCGALEALGAARGLAEALGVLHCALVPLLLLAGAPRRPRAQATVSYPKSLPCDPQGP